MIYLDYTATTPVDDEILDTYIKSTKTFFANSSSIHMLGQRSNHMIEVCSQTIFDCLDIKNHNIIYTTNATEANNIGLLGYCNKYHGQGKKIITTKIEHASVFNVFKSLENDFDVCYLDINQNGLVDLDKLEKEMDKNVVLISIMWTNNIIGTIQNVKEIINIVKRYKTAKLHVDCVQGICKVKPDFDFNDIDMFTISSHKIYGPKGIAALLVKRSIELNPIIYGSNAQFGLKPGTMDVALISAFAKAIKKYIVLIDKNREYVKRLWLRLYEGLKNNKKIVINTPLDNISYYIMNISIPGVKGETTIHKLENYEIYISTGSACSSKIEKPEKTVLALTKSNDLALSAVRISLSFLTKDEEIDEFIKVMELI